MITIEIIEMLYLRFANIWGDRFTARHNPQLIEMWYEEWLDGLQGINPNCLRDALKYCKENLEWSPSIAEFIRICDRELKIPNPRECLELAVRRDFTFSIVKAIYDRIGDYKMSRMSENELMKLFIDYHFEEMANFRRKRAMEAHPIKEISHEDRSQIHGNNIRGNGLRKAEGYLF